MIVTLVGISGSGKSFWSKKLEKKGFIRICCDDLIEEKLSHELKKLGYTGIQDVAKWMGYPYEHRYKKTSAKYLQYEIEVMREVIEKIKTASDENIVVDTTGSLIYTHADILNQLSQYSKMVYLHTPYRVKRQMFELFVRDPKPIIWGDAFSLQEGESPKEALARCYEKLLLFRTDKYKKLAEIIFDYHLLRHERFSEDLLLEVIERYD